MPCFIQECFQLCIVRIYCLLSNCSYEVLELLVLCNKVCLRVYFYDSSGAFVFYSDAADTFCSDTASLLLSLCLSVLSQELNSSVHVAFCCGQRLFAVHHTSAGHFS